MTAAAQEILSNPPSNLVGGRFEPIAGDALVSLDPSQRGRVVWSGSPVPEHVDAAVEAARGALRQWSRWSLEQRAGVLLRYKALATERAGSIAELIAREVGKAMWDCKQEAAALAGKVDITLETGPHTGRQRVSGFSLDLGQAREGRCWFRPHGVMAVVGPFNFPAHLPNGHIVPALLMGNTVVLKPSDKAPAVGQLIVELLQQALDEAGAPKGVLNLVQGKADVAQRLVNHPGIDGIAFTGSWPVGRKILEQNLDRPGRIVALEMGGNNGVLVMPDADLRQAAIEVARGAFVTTGQRCTCGRRLIVHEAVAGRLIPAILKAAASMVVGPPGSEAPIFMGPIIDDHARDAVLGFQARAAERGGEILMPATAPSSLPDGSYVTPGVVRVDRFTAGEGDDAGCDVEVFGPMLRIATVSSYEEGIEQVNATRYGLAASIFTKDEKTIADFLADARAGCVNLNCATAGASSKLPFGGLGTSGNHRPAGAFALDYCAYPVAGMLERGDAAVVAPGMAFEDAWLG
ncbi:MAG: aldehyde dehydrogenase family protein [Phycisphaeraceae bacterium]|nr:aldehyde dehydrogenase family protein [Phycisphaeraceae bacterium]